jgi:hypothetical protein
MVYLATLTISLIVVSSWIYGRNTDLVGEAIGVRGGIGCIFLIQNTREVTVSITKKINKWYKKKHPQYREMLEIRNELTLEENKLIEYINKGLSSPTVITKRKQND